MRDDNNEDNTNANNNFNYNWYNTDTTVGRGHSNNITTTNSINNIILIPTVTALIAIPVIMISSDNSYRSSVALNLALMTGKPQLC